MWNFCVLLEAGLWFTLADSTSKLTLATVPLAGQREALR